MTRIATIDDADVTIEVVRRSILLLCVDDHRNDQVTLDRWLANKNPEAFGRWINDPESFCVVEEVDEKVQGVGLVRESGEVLLFYVAPGYQRMGLGRRIHEALEDHARRLGLASLQLESTAAARHFYESLGYVTSGPEKVVFGVLRAYPYMKSL